MNKYEYTGNKTKNYFTAYLQKCVQWKRQRYLKKQEDINNIEESLEDNIKIGYITVEEMVELHYRENLLLKECKGEYPRWNQLSDQKLVSSLLLLCKEEREIIYQHVFEEKSFEEIACLNEITREKAKQIYYYAIRK